MTKSICSGICERKEIDVSTLINHFMISKPLEERLNEVTWTVYAIFKCAGRVSCTLEMQCGQVKISRKWRLVVSHAPLASSTSEAEAVNRAIKCLGVHLAPFNLSSSALTRDVSSGPISSRLHVRHWEERPRVQARGRRHQSLASGGHLLVTSL